MSRNVIRVAAAGCASLALCAAGVSTSFAAPTEAAPSAHLVISEVYGGGGNSGATYTNDFVELYNPTSQPQSIDGWTLQYRSSSSTKAVNAGNVATLSGTVQPGGYFLVQAAQGAGGTEALPTPDAVIDLKLSGKRGQVALVSSTEPIPAHSGDIVAEETAQHIVDYVGWGTSKVFETAPAPGTTNTTSVSRLSVAVDTDNNEKDFAQTEPTPVSAGSTAPTPEPEPTPDPTPQPDPKPSPAPGSLATIGEIQGTGPVSPLVGKRVTTSGVVTAVQTGRSGFVIQTPTAQVPNGFEGSSGLFVFSRELDTVKVGDEVRVSGEVKEFYGLTELSADKSGVEVLAHDRSAEVAPLTTAWPETEADRESLESMLIAPQGEYRVNDNYQLNRFGEVTLAVGGAPLVQPTQVGTPGSDQARAQVAYNDAHRVLLDDASSTDFTRKAPATLPYLGTDGGWATIGSQVSFVKPVVVTFGHGSWRFDPQHTLVGTDPAVMPVSFSTVREAKPADVGGDFKLATFNVLNYFTALGENNATPCEAYTDREGNPITAKNCLMRGAWNIPNFERQQAKIVAAINEMGRAGADVLSLEEIENSAYFGKRRDHTLAHLVEELNKADSSQGWAYVPSPAVVPATGDDVIRTAFIYKPARVSVEGTSRILDDPAFVNARAPLAQTFTHLKTGKRVLVIVNHFKSKGGRNTTGDNANPGANDPAKDVGNYNGDRTRQAEALIRFADEERARTKPNTTFLAGDFNAYSYESPVQTIVNAGYTDLENPVLRPSKHSATSWNEYSYSYGGMLGSLDHVFVSNESEPSITDADTWTINAYESVAREYSRYNYTGTNYYRDGVFRASDHNPVIVGLQLNEDVTEPTPLPNPLPTSPVTPSPSSSPSITPAPPVNPGDGGGEGSSHGEGSGAPSAPGDGDSGALPNTGAGEFTPLWWTVLGLLAFTAGGAVTLSRARARHADVSE